MEILILLALLCVLCTSVTATCLFFWWYTKKQEDDEDDEAKDSEKDAPSQAPPSNSPPPRPTVPQKPITQIKDLVDGVYKATTGTPFHFENHMIYYSVQSLGLSFMQNLGSGTLKYFIKDTKVYRLSYDETTLTRVGTIYGDVDGFRVELFTGEKLPYKFDANYPLTGNRKLEIDTLKEASGDYLTQIRSFLQPLILQMV